ncbi:amidase [Skermanella sp. TT6]|uniref:Amidase n=1 Tax=Skermanella cutis TaxID=2775420 RepID=A0ABX7B0A1_9PROT|nr:amidase [Skermanella sp. TT6]QQP87581.1 amidase [Skermanella sp. TT6]
MTAFPSTLRRIAGGAAGDAVPAALADAVRLDGRLHAFAYLPREVLPQAGGGPLAGVPVAVKDIIDTADMPTGYGSRIDPGFRPPADAWIVERIRRLGGTVIGKTVTTEFAWRNPGPTVNPHDGSRTPGGSSSGSAAAVAAGIVPLAIGTQTIGSVVRPAAFCGVVGFKPSFGAIPRTGVHPLAWSLDHVGLFTPSVADAAYALAHFAAADPSDPHGMVPDGLDGDASALPAARIAVIDPPAWDRVGPDQRAARDRAAAALAAAGAIVETIKLDGAYGRTLEDIMTVLRVEARHIFRDRVERFPDRTSRHLQALVSDGRGIDAETYAGALGRQKSLRHGMASHFDGFDAVLTVPATGEAPKGLDDTGDPALCAPWTFIGAPAITLPCAKGPNGMPLGIQLVAPWRRDARLMAVAAFAERALAS